MDLLKKLVYPIVPVKFVAKLLLKKLMKKLVNKPLDFDSGSFDADTIRISDLNLDCGVLSEKLGGCVILKRVHVGSITIRFSRTN